MTGNKFIFSNRPDHRITRHLVFWLVYSLYFFPQSIWYPDSLDQLLRPQVYWDALLNFGCFIPACVFSVYISIYGLLPVFLKRKRYAGFALAFIFLFIVDIAINYFFSRLYYSLVSDPEANTTFIGLLNLSYVNSMAAIIISGIALGIKATKNWHQQQRENLAIAKKKARIDLQLQKASIHPEFLFRTLNSINANISTRADDASEMVLRLSDLLSYTLYNGKEKLVPIEQELTALQDFVFLEERKQDNVFDLSLYITGTYQAKYIAPMIILSLLNDSITFVNTRDPGSRVIATRVGSHNNWLFVSVSFQLPETLPIWTDSESVVKNCRRRLAASYAPGDYQIEIKKEDSEILIALKLKLKSSLSKTIKRSGTKTKQSNYEPV